VSAAEGKPETHVAGVKVSDPGAIVAEVRVDAIGIEQTVSEQLEHWASREGRNRLTRSSQQVVGR
jgi:hypothetical protein